MLKVLDCIFLSDADRILHYFWYNFWNKSEFMMHLTFDHTHLVAPSLTAIGEDHTHLFAPSLTAIGENSSLH